VTERYFGACVLDSLIYRSEKQTIALMEQLFQRTIPDLLRRHSPPGEVKQPWIELLRLSSIEPLQQLRIVPVIKSNDPPTKSGPALARLYRRHLAFQDQWIIWPNQLEFVKKSGITRFLFIDDFLGTGDQFCEFAHNFGLSASLQGCYSVYAPLVAYKGGIINIQQHLSNMHVVAAEEIDNTYSLFSDESPWFEDGVNTVPMARAFYDSIVARLNAPIKPEALRGYGKLSLAYAFNHATPDNCLPK
jgi:hypothetical protein